MTKRRWLVLASAALAVLGANAALSGALELGWARRTLLARLSASFGRPVEVRHFQFNLLSGLRLEANSVTVSEDPRFGQEYFLRADQLSAGLRWSALLRGRFEFGVVSLTHPSLNLVRLRDGTWNIQSWLPPAAQIVTTAAAPAGTGVPNGGARRIAARLSLLEVDSGRINFKLGDDKLPFALVGVTGYLTQDSSGRWNIDLEADPMRAPVPLQNAGTLRLRGTVAGTSARLRPAVFQLDWADASLADALRLLDGTDHGVRGALSAQFSATIASPALAEPRGNSPTQWNFAGGVRLSGVHRWDLSESPIDPTVNAVVSASWRPGEPRLEVSRLVVEAPRSRVNASGLLDWSHSLNPTVHLASSTIGFTDLLAWRRAFFPGVAEDLSVDGALTVDVSATGWPPRFQQADISTSGAVVRSQALPGALRIGEVEGHLRHDTLTFAPASVSLPGLASRGAARNAPDPAPAGELQIAGSFGPMTAGDPFRDWQYRLNISGETERAQDLVALAGVFRHPANLGWSVEGPVALQLAWSGALSRGFSATKGTLDLHDLQLRSAALNKPVIVGAAAVILKGSEREIRLSRLQAFGANWTGTVHRPAAAASWDFDLSADRLDATGLNAWLGPAERRSLLDRILQFVAPRESASARQAVFARIAARGRLRVGDLVLSSVRVGNLDADTEIGGPSLVLHHAQADLFGGRVNGDFSASLAAVPSYSFRGRLDRVDVGSLSDSIDSLAGRFAGLATGELSLSAHGASRQPLLASLQGEGVLRLRSLTVRGVDLAPDRSPDRIFERTQARVEPASARTAQEDPPTESRFSSAAGTFHVAAGQVRIDQLLLVGRDEQLEVDGTVNFARRMNLRARLVPRDALRPAEIESQDAEADTWTVSGTLDSPQARLQTSVAGTRPIPTGARH